MNEFNPTQKKEITLNGDHAELLKGVLARHMADVNDVYKTLDGSAVPAQPSHVPRTVDSDQPIRQAQFAQAESVVVKAVETAPEVQRFGIQTGAGRIVEVDIDKFPVDHNIHALVKPLVVNGQGELVFMQEEVVTENGVSLAGRMPTNYATKPEVAKRFKRPGGRKIAAAVLALTVAGGGVAFATNSGVFKTDATQAALNPNVDTIADPAAQEADPGVQLTAGRIAVGDCLAPETGEGKALIQGKLTADADVKWNLKLLDGTIGTAMDEEGIFPKLTIPEDVVNLAACITPEKRDAAVKVGADNVVEINFDAIEQQIGIVQGAMKPSSERWEGMSAVPGETSEQVVADLMASMNNSAENADIAIPIARANAAAAFIGDPEKVKEVRAAMQTKLEADINARVADLYAAQKSPVDKVTVKFSGEQNNLTYKGPKAPETTKFTVDNLKSTITLNPTP